MKPNKQTSKQINKLKNLVIFEEKRPNTFKVMYQFWVSKISSEYKKAFRFHSLFVVSAPKFTLIEARRA